MRLPITILAAALLAAPASAEHSLGYTKVEWTYITLDPQSPASDDTRRDALAPPATADYVVIEMEKLMVTSVQPAVLEPDDELRVTVAPEPCEGRTEDAACLWAEATIERSDGTLEDVDLDGVDDIGLWIPADEAICLGSSNCDDLLWMCEQDDGCDFTCHVAVPNPDGQACVFGSTD